MSQHASILVSERVRERGCDGGRCPSMPYQRELESEGVVGVDVPACLITAGDVIGDLNQPACVV